MKTSIKTNKSNQKEKHTTAKNSIKADEHTFSYC